MSTKLVNFSYGTVSIPTSVVPSDIVIQVLDAGGTSIGALQSHAPYGADSFTTPELVAGTYSIRVFNNSNAGPIGASMDTPQFTIEDTQVVSVVVGISLA